jgi:exocyst complex component 6
MSLINSKLDDFFGLSEYDWTPATRENAPSMYLYELVNWLTTIVDSLQISDSYKDEAYRAATAYIAQSFMVRLSSRSSSLLPFIFFVFFSPSSWLECVCD